MPHPIPLRRGACDHIYNRGNSAENLFREERNYPHFLKLYARHVEPIAETFAYCLLKNHFHLLVRIKDPDPDPKGFYRRYPLGSGGLPLGAGGFGRTVYFQQKPFGS